MRLQTTLLAVLMAFLITPVAHAQDASAVVSRMDTIIKQMETLKAEFAALAASLKPAGAVLGSQVSSKSVFTMSLEPGETNDDIKKIQKFLATDPEIYPYGVASGFFGPKTEEGIKNFQTRFGLNAVGVVGPATKSLLELFFNAYPNGEYPADVLKKGKPQVAGAATSVLPPATPATATPETLITGTIEEIAAKYDGEEAKVKVYFKSGESESFVVAGDTKIEVVDIIAVKLGKTRAQILAAIEFSSASSKRTDGDFTVDVEVDDDEVIVSFEYDGDEYEVEVDSTDEDDVIDEVAEALDTTVRKLDSDLKKEILNALEEALDDADATKGDRDEIESIVASIADGEAEIEVEFGNGDDDSFTVEETLEAKIIAEVADELNIDEDEVEDLIEFEYEDIDKIRVEIKAGKALAFVEFEDGTVKRVRISSDNEDTIIKKLAGELDEDKDDIEDWVEFDYFD